MGSGINKKSKAERQADMGEVVRRAREEQAALAGKQPVRVEIDADDEDIEDLLGSVPVNVPRTRSATVRQKPERTVVARTSKGQMVRFFTQAGQEIIGMGTRYYVVKAEGRLHYKAEDACFVLPDDWTEEDGIPQAALDMEKPRVFRPAPIIPPELKTPGIPESTVVDDDLL
jgi:hypothetical protein